MKKTLKLQSISYSDCFEDGPVSIELVQHYLSRYSCKSVLETVSALSFLRGCVNLAPTGRDLSPKRMWHALIRATFGSRAIRRSIGDDAGIIFQRRSLLLVAREALRACPNEGRDPRDQEHLGEIGRVLIAAADLFRPMSESDDDQLAATAASNMFAGTGIKNRVVSSLRMLDALLRQFPLADDPNLTFQRVVGIGISEYHGLCLLTFLPILIDALNIGSAVADEIDFKKFTSGISISRLMHAGYTRKQIDYFLHSTSQDIDSARREAETPPYRSELTLFRKWPLLRIASDNYLVIDSGFLLDKLYTGPFLTLIDHARGGDQVRNWQGPAFEDYANWLLSNSVDPVRENVISSPRFLINNENEEICDIALWSGESAVLIECKGCFLRLQASEGLEGGKLSGAIEEKFLLKKGVPQLATSISRLYGTRSTDNTRHDSLKKATTVYPVLLVRDEIADSVGINSKLNDHFQTLIKNTELRVSVRPLLCLSSGTLQSIAAFLQERRFVDMLERRLQIEPALQFSAGVLFSRHLNGYGEPCQAVVADFDRIIEKYCWSNSSPNATNAAEELADWELVAAAKEFVSPRRTGQIGRAFALAADGNIDESVEEFDDAEVDGEVDALAYRDYAMVMFVYGRISRAYFCSQHALALEPKIRLDTVLRTVLRDQPQSFGRDGSPKQQSAKAFTRLRLQYIRSKAI